MSTAIAAPPRPWRRPLILALVTELLYLLYFLVPIGTGHTATILPSLSARAGAAGSPAQIALLYVACLGGLFIAQAILLRDLFRRQQTALDERIVLGGAALFAITLAFTPSMLSKDLFDYMAHGRVLSHYGANPFVTPAAAFPPDQFTQAMGWAGATPLYGPAWASFCALITLIGRGGFSATAVLFKLLFAGVHMINGLLVMGIARRWGGRPVKAAAFYLWNPLVLTQSVADAHNDGIVLLWLLLGVWLLQRRDEAMGWACAALSVLTKYVTAPVLLLMGIQRWREGGLRRVLLAAACCAGVAALAYAPYLSGFQAGHFLRPYEHASYQGGLMMMVEMALGQVLGGGNDPGTPVATGMVAATLVAAGCLGLWYLRACLRGTGSLAESVESGTRLLLFYLLFVTALLRTSYLVWIIGPAAVVASVPLRRTVAIFSASVLSLEVFWIYRLLQPSEGASLNGAKFLASAVAVGAPILYLLVHFRGRSSRSGA